VLGTNFGLVVVLLCWASLGVGAAGGWMTGSSAPAPVVADFFDPMVVMLLGQVQLAALWYPASSFSRLSWI